MAIKEIISNLGGFDCWTNSPSQYQRKCIGNSIKNIILTSMLGNKNKGLTHGATISAASAKSFALLAANWTIKGRSPMKNRESNSYIKW